MSNMSIFLQNELLHALIAFLLSACLYILTINTRRIGFMNRRQKHVMNVLIAMSKKSTSTSKAVLQKLDDDIDEEIRALVKINGE